MIPEKLSKFLNQRYITNTRNAVLIWHSVSSLQKDKQYRDDMNLHILEPDMFGSTLTHQIF